jgi:hypothetical protein
MWETLDIRDQALVRMTQRELWREAEMQRMARKLRTPRRSVFGVLAARLGTRRQAA